MSDFDAGRAKLQDPDVFPRLTVEGDGTPLREMKFDPADYLIAFERGGERRALRADAMAYHHVAQGTLAGEPYLVAF